MADSTAIILQLWDINSDTVYGCVYAHRFPEACVKVGEWQDDLAAPATPLSLLQWEATWAKYSETMLCSTNLVTYADAFYGTADIIDRNYRVSIYRPAEDNSDYIATSSSGIVNNKQSLGLGLWPRDILFPYLLWPTRFRNVNFK